MEPQEHLEWSLILLWELITNQWTMFETQEDSVLDALFRLRPMSNSVVGLQASLPLLITSDPSGHQLDHVIACGSIRSAVHAVTSALGSR